MEEEVIRVRIPKEGEILGKVTAMLGANRIQVECDDGKERICRIPGKMKKRIWTRVDDIVLIKPWEYQYDTRGDLVWKYTKNQAYVLKKKGYLKNIEI
ncbi:MAG: translation initiation factor eIF-1A [Candidatus Aenigmarchaeota archaeon]|nr:translation initiation factor eIF-1A [Candidatus Aenigmarchaeota archaeon]